VSNRRKIRPRLRRTPAGDVAIQGVFAEAAKLVEDALARVALHPDDKYREGFRDGVRETRKMMVDATYRAAEAEREAAMNGGRAE
jgi:hypothetical protein